MSRVNTLCEVSAWSQRAANDKKGHTCAKYVLGARPLLVRRGIRKLLHIGQCIPGGGAIEEERWWTVDGSKRARGMPVETVAKQITTYDVKAVGQKYFSCFVSSMIECPLRAAALPPVSTAPRYSVILSSQTLWLYGSSFICTGHSLKKPKKKTEKESEHTFEPCATSLLHHNLSSAPLARSSRCTLSSYPCCQSSYKAEHERRTTCLMRIPCTLCQKMHTCIVQCAGRRERYR
jgi:hypothetical protein